MFNLLNSHFILAVFSPMLLIVMVVTAILSLMPKRRKASCILAVLAIPVSLTTDVLHIMKSNNHNIIVHNVSMVYVV